MKKNMALWFVLVLCAALVIGCGKKEETNTNEGNQTETEDNVNDTVEDTEDGETEEEPAGDADQGTTEEETEEPETEDTTTEEPEIEDTTTEEPETEEPETEQPEQSTGAVDLMAIYEALANAYGENFIPTMLMNAANEYDVETLNMMIWVADENGEGKGLSADLYDEYMAATPMIGFHPDTVIMVKAKEGKMPEVMAFLEALKESKVDPMNNYPSNLPKQEAIRIDTYGDYVFFYTLGAPNDTETDEAALLEYYTEQNQIAADVIAGFFQ